MKLSKLLLPMITAATISLFGTLSTHAEDLTTIRESGKLRIAMTGAYPPFNFVDTENNVVGFDPAVGIELAKRIGVEAEIVTTAWDGIIGGLLGNRFDAIVGSMSITEERSEVVDFVGPYYRTRRAIFAKEGSDLKSVKDLSEDTLFGTVLGETHEQWAREQGYNVRTYKGLPEILIELEAGRVDVIAVDLAGGSLGARQAGQAVQVLTDLETPDDNIGIAIRKGNPELAKALQAALDDMMEDGTYGTISVKWIGRDLR